MRSFESPINYFGAGGFPFLLHWPDWGYCLPLPAPGLVVAPFLSKLEPPPQFLSSALTRTETRRSMPPSWDCGMCFKQRITIIIFIRDDLIPPHPSRSSNPSRPGTRMELNLKMHFFHPPAEISASASGRTWTTVESSCTISV